MRNPKNAIGGCLQPFAGIAVSIGVLIFQTFESQADVRLYEVGPDQSPLTLQGSTAGVNWSEQAPGSLTAQVKGVLAVDSYESYLQFIVGSHLTLQPGGNWLPEPKGSGQSLPADFGGLVTVGSHIGTVSVVAAIRDLSFDLSSEVTPSDGTVYDSSAVVFSVPSPGPAHINYTEQFELGGIFGVTKSLSGQVGNNADPNGRFTPILGEVQRIFLPVDIQLPVQLFPGDTTLQLTGTLAGSRGVAILNPKLLWVHSPKNPKKITLVWESNYRLQSATQLEPADWTDTGFVPPVEVDLSGPSAFFRVIP